MRLSAGACVRLNSICSGEKVGVFGGRSESWDESCVSYCSLSSVGGVVMFSGRGPWPGGLKDGLHCQGG